MTLTPPSPLSMPKRLERGVEKERIMGGPMVFFSAKKKKAPDVIALKRFACDNSCDILTKPINPPPLHAFRHGEGAGG